MEKEKSLRDYRTFSPDLGVPRFEGLNRVPDDLRPERSNATWPRVFMREDQALRAFSEPGVSRRRGTEGKSNCNYDGERHQPGVSLRCDTEVKSNYNYDGERHQPGVSLRCDTEVESNCNYDGERHQPGVSLRCDTEVESNCNYDGERHQPGVSLRRDTEVKSYYNYDEERHGRRVLRPQQATDRLLRTPRRRSRSSSSGSRDEARERLKNRGLRPKSNMDSRLGRKRSHNCEVADEGDRNPISETGLDPPTTFDVLAIENCEQDWIATVQSADEEVKKIKETLLDPDSRQVMDIHKNYKLKNNRIYRMVGDEIKWLVLDDTVNVTSTDKLAEIRDEAGKKIRDTQVKDKERFNSQRKAAKTYSAGDLVRIERRVHNDGQSQKLAVKYQGPYRVIKALPNDRYVIEDTPLSRKNNRRYEAVVAVDKMQPWLNYSRNLESSCEESGSDAD
ncbi:hypothetical protein ACJJTC_003250 [Scirpophaga incertulas]